MGNSNLRPRRRHVCASPIVSTSSPGVFTFLSRLAFPCVVALLSLTVGCSHDSGGGAPPSSEKSTAEYCPYVSAPLSYSPKVTVSGKAHYQYRLNGNGAVTNGTFYFAPTTTGTTTSLVLQGVTFSVGSPQFATAAGIVAKLVSDINADATASAIMTASAASNPWGHVSLKLVPKDPKVFASIGTLTNLTQEGGNPNPIRYAEVRATDSAGAIVQCGETDADGSFAIDLPQNGATYTISVASRAANSANSAYILTNPTDNQFYALSATVTASTDDSSLWLMASATGTLEGGAFNILDQILKAQEYVRAQTASCGSTFTDCVPFSVAPLVYVYWAPGISPGQYFGISGGISFYLNGQKKLYLLGGLNDDTTSSDMDHFDNSVIIHEYGHFLEDQFASPDSPGGSHNGNSIIDPRLAWGEGWADFFQAAVTGSPYYRDTTGTVDCSTSNPTSCTHTSFNEPLDYPGSQDQPASSPNGEGNFREFSVARILWAAIKGPTPVSPFAELWTVLNSATNGFKSVNDPYKHIGRFHVIQSTLTGGANWSTLRTNERQVGNMSVYATPLSACSSAISLSPVKPASDDGSYAKSDQHRNNDFYRYDHSGGPFTLTLTYDKPSSNGGDLDLYVYKEKYVFGRTSDMVAVSNAEADRVGATTQGAETVSLVLPAGHYIINVMAYTGVRAVATTYTLTLNDQQVCPNP